MDGSLDTALHTSTLKNKVEAFCIGRGLLDDRVCGFASLGKAFCGILRARTHWEGVALRCKAFSGGELHALIVDVDSYDMRGIICRCDAATCEGSGREGCQVRLHRPCLQKEARTEETNCSCSEHEHRLAFLDVDPPGGVENYRERLDQRSLLVGARIGDGIEELCRVVDEGLQGTVRVGVDLGGRSEAHWVFCGLSGSTRLAEEQVQPASLLVHRL